MDSEQAMAGGGSKIKLTVKFGSRSIPVEMDSNLTIKELKVVLQTLTNVLPRGQKLICKGKVLSDELSLASSGIGDRSKIMLVASEGLHQGGAPITKKVEVLPNARREIAITGGHKQKKEEPVTMSRVERWKITGIIALSNCGFRTIPEEAWTLGSLAKVLDVSHNSLLEVPDAIGRLSSIQKLLLHGNHLSEQTISWDEIASLKRLIVLSLDNNKLQTIPASIGGCVSLVEVDLSRNILTELPETFSNLKNLKALYLCNNALKSLPTMLFKMCLQLSTLDLHGTEITMDLLRQSEGWESFDERRRSKHQKQLEFRVSGSGEFDEGADKNW